MRMVTGHHGFYTGYCFDVSIRIDEEGIIVFSCCASIKALVSDLPPIDTSSNADSGAQFVRHSLRRHVEAQRPYQLKHFGEVHVLVSHPHHNSHVLRSTSG
jgi:hypothetical protein